MDQVNDRLYLKSEHWERMLADVKKRKSEEACGLVAGIDQTSQAVFPMTNVLHSPVRFLLDPEEQLRVFNQIEEKEWQLQAIYHSHLHGPEGPSAVDIAEANYPGVINLIWSNISGEWSCGGYLIEEKQVMQVAVNRLPVE